MIAPAAGLRILIVSDNCSPRLGGEAILAYHYFRILRARGEDVYLIAHERNRCDLRDAFPTEEFRIRYVRDDIAFRGLYHLGQLLPHRIDRATLRFALLIYSQLKQRRMIRTMVRELGINVVHQPTPVSPAVPSLLYELGVPVIVGPMNGGMNFPPGFRHRENALERMAVRLGRRMSDIVNRLFPGKRCASALLVANGRTEQTLPRCANRNVIRFTENGVDLSVWSAARQERAGPLRFVYLGRLVDWKGVDLLLRAWARLPQPRGASLRIIGDGPQRRALERLAAELGFAGQINFTGWLSQAECARHLSDADVLILPSLIECGGAVVLEAMACGLAVIATRWGGVTDYVTSETGLLVDPVSEEQFINGIAGAMQKLIDAPQLAERLGSIGRCRVRREFDWEKRIDRVLEIYRRCAGIAAPLQLGTHKQVNGQQQFEAGLRRRPDRAMLSR